LFIYQESLHDARSTECKILTAVFWNGRRMQHVLDEKLYKILSRNATRIHSLGEFAINRNENRSYF